VALIKIKIIYHALPMALHTDRGTYFHPICVFGWYSHVDGPAVNHHSSTWDLHQKKEERMDRAGNPPPNVLLMLAMALAAWGLVYMAATSVWSWHTELSNTTIESVHSPQIATIAEKPEAKPMRKRAKVNRRRPRRTSLTARVLRPAI